MSKVKFCRGTSKDFKPMVKDPDTIYYITDTKQMFLGEDEYCTGEGDASTYAGRIDIDRDGSIIIESDTVTNIVDMIKEAILPWVYDFDNNVYNCTWFLINDNDNSMQVRLSNFGGGSAGEYIFMHEIWLDIDSNTYEVLESLYTPEQIPFRSGIITKPYELTDNNYSSAYLFNSTFNVTNCANAGGTLVGANLNAFISRLYMWAAQQTEGYDMPVFKLHFGLWSTYHNDINATFIALNNIPLGSGWVLEPNIHLYTKWGEPVIERIVPGEEAGMDEIVVSYLTINDVATSVAPVVMNNNSEVELTGDIVFNPRYTGTAN